MKRAWHWWKMHPKAQHAITIATWSAALALNLIKDGSKLILVWAIVAIAVNTVQLALKIWSPA